MKKIIKISTKLLRQDNGKIGFGFELYGIGIFKMMEPATKYNVPIQFDTKEQWEDINERLKEALS